MKRRDFMLLTAAASAATLAPQIGLAATAPLDYQPALLNERLKAGDTVFLDFKASWCTTCRAQERAINALKADNPAYDEAITFINVDWDEWGRSDLVKQLNVPRRSTLVVLRGNQELGRIVADTSKANIKALMDTALAAAV